MKISGRRRIVFTAIVFVGLAGCGAAPDGGDRSSQDDVSMAAPPEIDNADVDNVGLESDGGTDWSAEDVGAPEAMFVPDDPDATLGLELELPAMDAGSDDPFGPLNAAAPESPVVDSVIPPPADVGFVQEKVYYGTNRKPEESERDRWATYGTVLRRFQVLLVIGVTLCGAAFYVPRRRVVVIIAAVLCLAGSAWSGRRATLEYQQAERDDTNRNRRYGNGIHFENGRHVLERGYCWVSVPVKVHERGSGELEQPGLLELQADPEKHFTLQRVEHAERTDFLDDLQAAVQDSDAKHAFVFIHGYNVLFREAALRTAQLRYDLDFDGPAAFFSWPSNGSVLSYASDEETANLTERSGVLHEFLTDFIRETGAESVHLIAHSMGNRLMTRAFEKLPETTNSRGHKTISQLIMAAPDVNPAEFLLLADRIRELTRARILYASEKDIALMGSEVLRMSNYTRLGQGGQSRVIVDGVQTIDASGLSRELFDLGHSYYVHPMVMRDLKQLLNSAEATQMRPWLMSVDDYWIFRDE